MAAHSNLGKILGENNNIHEAKKHYEKALNLNPNSKEACDGYGRLLLKLNQHNKALAYIRKGSGCIRFTEKNFKII